VSDFFFPLLFLTPDFDGDMIGSDQIAIIRRKRSTSIFDLAILHTQHNLNLPYQVMDVFLGRCNLELRVSGCDEYEDACRIFLAVRIGLYAAGMSPFMSPFVATHSIDDYSGINSRDSEMLRQKLPEEMRPGLTSAKGKVSAWPFELSFQCVLLQHKLNATALRLENGIDIGQKWLELIEGNPALQVVADAASDAPKLGNMDQSLLHVWSALEAIFPTVSQEVSFRLAIYLAQLIGAPDHRLWVYRRVKKAYGVRSRVAHGSKRNISSEEWLESWQLLMLTITAIVRRGSMPDETKLMEEVLGPDSKGVQELME
jgi:hypothetical protein